MNGAPVQQAQPAATQPGGAVDEALAKLRTKRITDHRIHQARRALKKARAALRVLRPALGERVYQLENVTLRDAGRHLSPLRDAKATLETFDALIARCAEPLRDIDLEPLHRVLELDLVFVRRMVRRPSEPLDACIELLEAHRDRMRNAMRAGAVNDDAARAIKQIYRKGRKALAAAEATVAPEALHEWRKQVKYLLNAVDLIHGEVGPAVGKLLARADRIADLLGEDHDLTVLHRIALDHRVETLTPEAVEALTSTIGHRRRKLQRRAIKLGRRVFERKAGRFVRWLLEDAPSAP